MHAYSKRFLQVLLVGIQMATYLFDTCLPKLEFLDGKDSKNYGISLTGPNSHNNRVSIEIGTKNKQTEAEQRKNYSRAYMRPGGLPTLTCPRATSCAIAGLWPVWFHSHSRVRSVGSDSGRLNYARLTRVV